jgi:signal transduction histidine kinase
MGAAHRPVARYPWALCAFTCACLATYVGLYVHTGQLLSAASITEGFPIIPLGVVLSAVVGALVLTRHPRHRIGWLLSIAAAGVAAGFVASGCAYWLLAMRDPDAVAAGHAAAWVAQVFGASYALPLTCAVFLLVPDGRLLSRRWRPVMVLLVASYVLWLGVLVFGVRPRQVYADGIRPGPVAGDLLDLSATMLLVVVIAAAVALVLRLRRSTGVQRQQVRWIMAAGVLIAVGLVALGVYQIFVRNDAPWYVLLPLYIGYASVPVVTGIAILRYRLYDIDVIINRAVVLAVLAGFVTVGYVAVVVVIGAALGTTVLDRFWPSLVALVVVALAFQPLRQRVLRLADRLVYGDRAVPYEALADLNRRLGRTPAPSDLLPELAQAVARSVGAARTSVRLDVPGGDGLHAAWPAGSVAGPAGSVVWPAGAESAPDAEFEVRDRGEPLGAIAVAMPPGRGLRPAERRLLADFAEHAGLAFRNLALDAELQARVEHLGRQSADLAASRHRLLATRDDERQRIAAIIDREVLTHLRPIPAAIDLLDGPDTRSADSVLGRLEAATTAGLDALRDVTQGLFPAALARRGLVPALRAHLVRTGQAADIDVAASLAGQRFADRVESAAYFCAVAMLRRLATPDRLTLGVQAGSLVLEATIHGDPDPVTQGEPAGPGRPIDWTAMTDRVEAAGGWLIRDEVNGDVRLRVGFPVTA